MKNEFQKAYFPMQYLRVTQGRGYGSHSGTYAFDMGGKDGGKDAVFAPCNIKITRVRTGKDSGEVYAESLEPVLLPDGTSSVLHFTFIHDDQVQVNAGQIIRQGERFYTEGGRSGGKDGIFGNHLHLEVGRGRSPNRQVKNGWGCWMTPNTQPMEQLLWVKPDTVILATGGYTWTFDEEEKPMQSISQENIILQVGPASLGDRVTMASLAANMGLPMSETEDGLMYIGPASPGDQVALIEKSEGLGLPVREYNEPEEDARDQRIAALEKELAAANEQLAACKKELAAAEEKCAMFERTAVKYYEAIKVARAALEV